MKDAGACLQCLALHLIKLIFKQGPPCHFIIIITWLNIHRRRKKKYCLTSWLLRNYPVYFVLKQCYFADLFLFFVLVAVNCTVTEGNASVYVCGNASAFVLYSPDRIHPPIRVCLVMTSCPGNGFEGVSAKNCFIKNTLFKKRLFAFVFFSCCCVCVGNCEMLCFWLAYGWVIFFIWYTVVVFSSISLWNILMIISETL